MKRIVLAMVVVGLVGTARGDETIVNEDFESYADDTELRQQWLPSANADNGLLADENYSEPAGRAFPEGGHGVDHIGNNVMVWQTPFAISPSETQSVVLQGDLFDVNGALFNNKRLSIGLRSGGSSLIELGFWNANDGTPFEGSPFVIKYAYRLQNWGVVPPATNPNWQYFEVDPSLDRDDDLDTIVNSGDVGEAWHRYRVTVTPTTVTLQFDLFADGLINTASSGSPPEDFNGNGTVDAADYTIWRDNTLGPDVPAAAGDADNDGDADQDDYDLWVAAFGSTGSADQPGWDATIVYDMLIPTGPFDNLRIGGPSGLSSPDGENGAIFDNISLMLVDVPAQGGGAAAGALAVPEPATPMFAIVAAVALAGARWRHE